jgi:hypothetical protein
VSIDTVGPGQR